MTSKQAALDTLQTEFAWWENVLAKFDEAQITAPEFEHGWSVKDMVAHLYAWQQRSVARVKAALHNSEPEYPAWPEQFDPESEGQPHDLNAWLYEQFRDQPWSTVHQHWRETFLHLVALGEAVPEEDLADAKKYPWLEGYALVDVLQGSAEHHREHAEFLEPVLQRLGLDS